MKALKREIKDGNIILTVEDELFFGLIKKQTQYIGTREFPKGYWDWRLLPNKTLIGDRMSFQLDAWNKDFE